MGFSSDRAVHSLEVAKLMYSKAIELGKSEEYASKMFKLGWLHDIGYQFTDIQKEHSHVGGDFLKNEGYEFWAEVYNHGDDKLEYQSFELNLLNYADMQIDGKGNHVSFEERLSDISNRYGIESEQYIYAKRVIDGIWKIDISREEMSNILSGGDIEKIKYIIKNYTQESYDIISKQFNFFPVEIYLDIDPNEFPIDAIYAIKLDVDGAKGFNTNYTPQSVIEIYREGWKNVVNIQELSMKKTKYKYYEVKWINKNWGNVSGDIINSFPKKKLLTEYYKMGVNRDYVKLFARLCYTIGNFIPVPKLGRGKMSVNSLHSYHRSYLSKFGVERFDKFLFSITDKCSQYKSYYDNFGDYFDDGYIERNYLQGYIVDDKVVDLISGKPVLKKSDFQEFKCANDVNNYLINVCARVIFRGNNLMKVLDSKM